MDVKESEWVTKATENIDRYLNRGGHLKGDEPQLIGGSDLLNTIGVAMGLSVRDPKNWTESELNSALNNQLVYFEGDARKAIDVVANQIRECCGGEEKIFITVLPIELYVNGKLHELPLFRVQRYQNYQTYYVDHLGRCYDSYSDWCSNAQLPPCKMAYPYDLKLSMQQGSSNSHVVVDDTPSGRVGAKVLSGVDIAASVIGIASCVGLIFISGGLATPLVAAGLATAAWGTGRAGYQLIDKANHGQNINPFTNSESRMLWLGIAANLVSFGAMGASMRLTSLAMRGRDIATSFRVLVNVMNGTNLVVSGAAIADSTVYLIDHYEELSSVDILLHVAMMAFWTKGMFSYKTAGGLIKTAQEQTFKFISNKLNQDDAAVLLAARQQINNDAEFIREFQRAGKANISVENFAQILVDAKKQGQVQFDGAGNIILEGGLKYSFEFLSKLPQNVRSQFFEVITNLNPEQVKLMETFRQKVNNDMNLIQGLCNVAVYYRLSPREATTRVLNFWARYTSMNLPDPPDMKISDGSLMLGRAPPLQLTELDELSTSMVQFIGEHLVSMDDASSHQWNYSMPLLLQFERYGMFSTCKVTGIVPAGRAVVILNENLQISLYKLGEIDPGDCYGIIKLIGELPPTTSTANIPKMTKALIDKYRLRLECHRTESVDWMKSCADQRLLEILNTNLQSFEKDRLFTFRSTVTTAKAMPYIHEMMYFVAEMKPKNVSEMVSYGEYVVNYVEAEKRTMEGRLRSGELVLPPNTKKADFLRQKASEAVFRNHMEMRGEWLRTVQIVRDNGMVGPVMVGEGMSNEALVSVLHTVRIGFGSEAAAAYHILKHPTDPLSEYVIRANQCVRDATRWQATLTQDGDARMLRFEGPDGAAILLERDGRVLLCTFTPKKTKG